MSRFRLLILGALAVMMLSVVAASPALAANDTWELSEGDTFPAKVAEETKTVENAKLKWSEFETECTGAKLKGAQLEVEGKASGTGVTFTGCTVKKPATGCSVFAEKEEKGKGEISTKAVKAQGEVGTPDKLKFSPTVGTEFASFFLVGTGCGTAKGEHKVKGTATAVGNGTEETLAAEQELVFSATSGSALEVGSEKATLTGKAKAKLVSGHKFSA
jgi:hypothetical protein